MRQKQERKVTERRDEGEEWNRTKLEERGGTCKMRREQARR